MMQVRNPHSGQITGAIFLIGLGLLFALGWFWPGIFYLLGVVAIADGILNGKSLAGNLQGGLFMVGLGLVFTIGFSFPLLLIILGLMTLFGMGSSRMSHRSSIAGQAREQGQYGPWDVAAKAKNDWKYKISDPDQQAEEDREYRLGDDGELISVRKVKNG